MMNRFAQPTGYQQKYSNLFTALFLFFAVIHDTFNVKWWYE